MFSGLQDLGVGVLVHGRLHQLQQVLEGLLLPAGGVDLEVKVLGVGHLLVVRQILVRQLGQGGDEVAGQRRLVVLDLDKLTMISISCLLSRCSSVCPGSLISKLEL